MTAFSRDPLSPDPREAMARDLLGRVAAPASPVVHHAALSALDTGGPLSLCDAAWPIGHHVPAHAHAHEDEIIVVLSGVIELRMDGRAVRLGPGRTAFVPRATPHEVRAVTPARHIAILTRKSLDAA